MSLNTHKMAKSIARWIDDKRGEDIEVIDIHELTSLTEVFVIASANSDRQVQAIADYIEDNAEEEGLELIHREGRRNGRWILLDYNNIVVHLFHKEERSFYNIERLWSDGKRIILEDKE